MADKKITLHVDSFEFVDRFDGKDCAKLFVVMGGSSYYFDFSRVIVTDSGNGDVIDPEPEPNPEPPAPQEKTPMLHVVMKDGTSSYFSCPEGLRYDPSRQLLIVRDPRINSGPTFIPVGNILYWTTEMD